MAIKSEELTCTMTAIVEQIIRDYIHYYYSIRELWKKPTQINELAFSIGIV